VPPTTQPEGTSPKHDWACGWAASQIESNIENAMHGVLGIAFMLTQ
jgi:hypothetical protein